MSEITRKRLARGTKLMPEHGFGALSSAATQLGAQISADNLADPHGSFRINLQTAALGGALFLNTGTKGERGHLMIPFVLPPPQQEFSATGQQDTGDPSYILDEIQLSFDQRAEPCAIMDPTAVNGGLMNFAEVTDAYDIRLSIKEKEMQVFAGSTTPTVPTNEVAALDIPPGFFSGANARVNPAIIGDLEVALNPYRTYVVYVEASSMALASIDLAMVSLVISLRFKTKLKQRTTSSNSVQNLPTKHNGARTAATVTIQTPGAGSTPISSDSATGLQANIETVDDVFLNRLRGGYGKNCDVPPSQHLLVDSCYEVIAVNLFGFSQAITTSNVGDLPYVGGGSHTGDTFDRRIIPIVYPLTIHHVVAVESWATTPAVGNLRPNSPNMVHEVGVGLGTGHRSDAYRYQQVAYHSWNESPGGRAARSLDEIKERSGGTMSNVLSPDMQLFNIPLVNDTGAGNTRIGVTYPSPVSSTGSPIFCGQGITELDARSTIAQGVPAAAATPVTKGSEQWIEVRWNFGDNVNGLGHSATYPAGTVFVGYGGFWVYLICEKNLSQPGSGGIL